ncbi:hypothetical protein MHLP_03705 [Candidatus Mycoplasma haematolamae str. Purdue]|uniref:Uncharacterized protein n=1 Tax=Mycoplasma haematolamae (strain Purdue) TaxID=1212765 RepID=I7CGC9_MYCHA|nr:hypothetical protein [Candidatus Mycoplasma haematolamae]AFO52321.1 hypothetical protein MHLP_03705 [Candidatus Mycoplasma haematolamae str. Purdue]
MASSSLWLKGLSAQGKIYLATSSLAGGTVATGALAVDETRNKIGEGLSYLGYQVFSTLSEVFDAPEVPKDIRPSNDDTVSSFLRDAWSGFSYFVTKGVSLFWNSVVSVANLLKDSKENYKKYSPQAFALWSYLKTNYYTLWVFLRSSWSSIDLEKLYRILSGEQGRKIIEALTKEDGQNPWKSIVSSMEKLVNKASSKGFDVSKPFNKILSYFLDHPGNMTTMARRLDVLEKFIEKDGTQIQAIKALVDFFSTEENVIKNITYNGVHSNR